MKIGDFYDTSVGRYRIKLLSCKGVCVRGGSNSKRSKNKRIRPQPRAPTDDNVAQYIR